MLSKISKVVATAVFSGLIGSANAADTFTVTAIPDEAPTELQRKFKPLGDYLGEKTGKTVKFVPVTDYAAAVEALVNGKVEPIIQRVEDEAFKSVFITTADSGIKSLADLKGKTFAFGSPSSTSGHLMPRSFLLKDGINPDADMRVSFSGAHDATAFSVAGGKVAAGALNITVWEKLVESNKIDTDKVKVFYTTPPYYDYNWTVRKDMDPATRQALVDAFTALKPDDATGKQILDLQRASAFVPTKAENYADIEKAAISAGLIK